MQKKKSKIIHILNLILIPILCLVIVVMMVTLIKGLQIKLFAGSDYIAHGMNYEQYYLYFFQIELTVGLIILEINRFNQSHLLKSIKSKIYFKKGCLAVIFLNAVILVSSLFSSTFIYESHMTVRRPLSVRGITYSLEEVVKVETGYGKGKRENGAFYYNVTMEDGYVLEVNNCYPSDQYMGDNMYSWLQILDEKIMSLSPEKIVDLGSEKESYDYAEKYKRVFSTILLNS